MMSLLAVNDVVLTTIPVWFLATILLSIMVKDRIVHNGILPLYNKTVMISLIATRGGSRTFFGGHVL